MGSVYCIDVVCGSFIVIYGEFYFCVVNIGS